MATITSLKRIQPTALSKMLLSPDHDPTKIAIIDVRDDDYIGGHIKNAQNFPSRTLDATLPSLIRQLEDKPTVIFHCALSQQRGPSAALRYIRERDRLRANKSQKQTSSEEDQEEKVEQTVYVLDRGFVGWQESYGTDDRLTEGYRKELWEDGYWM
ncbi:arsenate reductase 2.1 [Rhypophila decipiens]|uniref:Arsenate reductase 2.1 n=1 Tax=Rhypophila decipiens TaxID=261697 RepID=A0AAN6YJE8_9PEZI|nr:arsenate reductase 2.1 [Rhypophila decipiens]